MAKKHIGKRYGGPWYSNFSQLLRFEKGAFEQHPSLVGRNIRSGHRLYREYTLGIRVKNYDCTRRVTIKIFSRSAHSPLVTCDGPGDSPHRYDTGELCMWYPYDPKEQRWVFEDGLLALIVYIEAHLFREEWWRETGEWLGPEIAHSSPESPPGFGES